MILSILYFYGLVAHNNTIFALPESEVVMRHLRLAHRLAHRVENEGFFLRRLLDQYYQQNIENC